MDPPKNYGPYAFVRVKLGHGNVGFVASRLTKVDRVVSRAALRQGIWLCGFGALWPVASAQLMRSWDDGTSTP